MLRTIIERLGTTAKGVPRVKEKGYNGCGELMKHGARDLKAFAKMNYARFVVCFDADLGCPRLKRTEIIEKIIKPSKLSLPICVLVPVQEIEAWILADVGALGKLFPTWRGRLNPIASPELIRDPKEHLRRLVLDKEKRPKYDHATHNASIARHLDLEEVKRKCPSFSPLAALIEAGEGNVH